MTIFFSDNGHIKIRFRVLSIQSFCYFSLFFLFMVVPYVYLFKISSFMCLDLSVVSSGQRPKSQQLDYLARYDSGLIEFNFSLLTIQCLNQVSVSICSHHLQPKVIFTTALGIWLFTPAYNIAWHA